MINEFGNYDSLEDFQSIDDYFHKPMTALLCNLIDGYWFELYKSEVSRRIIRKNKIPSHYIHEINNYFDLYIYITI